MLYEFSTRTHWGAYGARSSDHLPGFKGLLLRGRVTGEDKGRGGNGDMHHGLRGMDSPVHDVL